MTNQTPQQIIQKTEKKIKNMKKLENVLISGAALGVVTAITGLKLDNQISGAIVSLTGLGVGASSAMAGFYTILDRQVLQEYLKNYKKNNPPLIKLELKAEEPYKIVYDDKGEK
jgi:hypothetical protein